MKTKTNGIITVAAALLLLTAMLVTTGCDSITTGGSNGNGYTPPPGMGAVRLNFNQNISRSILPDDATLATFDTFDFLFAANGSGTTNDVTGVDKGDIYDPIPLDVGSYLLTVIAYIGTEEAATVDAAVAVTINANATTTTVPITLKPYAPNGTTEGKLSYTLTKLDTFTVTSATLTLTPVGGVGTTKGPVDITSFFDGTAREVDTIKSGYYYLDFEMTVTGDTVIFRYIVHIYRGMTSSYEFEVSKDNFKLLFQGFKADASLTFVAPVDTPPVLYSTSSPLSGPVTLGILGYASNPASITIDINNTFASYEWYCRDTNPLDTTNQFTVNTTTAPFDKAGTYELTVVGITAITSIPYSTVIEIIVVEAP